MRKKVLSVFMAVAMIFSLVTPVYATSKTRDDAINWVRSKENQKIGSGQCVALISAYYSYLGVSPVSGNGCDYATNSLPSGWTREKGGVPKKGDILVYTGGYGHVAIAETTSYGWHQNWGGQYVQWVDRNYSSSFYSSYEGVTKKYWGCIRPNFSDAPADKTPPTLNNLRITSANESSFTISAELDDNVAVKSVWLNVYGPGGNKGYSVSASKGTFNHTIKYIDYGGYGKYSVHAYVSDTSDNQGVQGMNNFYPSANRGNEFYGVILNKAVWKPIEVCEDNYVRLGIEDGTAKHVWRFNREGDGTYKITSAQNGKVLDVHGASIEDGAKLWTYDDVGGDNQRWILLEKNGGYVLHPRNTTRVLDLTNGNTENGTQVQICGSNGTDAQIFAIYTGNEVQLKAPVMTVKAGTSSSPTVFEWNESHIYGEKRFDVKIWKNKLFDGDAHHIEWGTHSSYSIKLPPGHYEAYVDASNELQCLRSNVVAFDVEFDTFHLYVISNVVSDGTKYIVNSDINLLIQPAVYAAALYASDGRMLDIQTVSLSGGETSASAALSKRTDASYIKVFLWDDLESMQPLCDCERLSI